MSEFDRRYRSAFGDRPWYAEVQFQWEERGHDDDSLRDSIDRMLGELAASEGLLLANDRCGDCGCDLPSSLEHAPPDDWYGRCCFTCVEIQDAERERDEMAALAEALRWWNLSPAERDAELAEAHRTMRFFTQGLISRDVQ